MASSNDANSNDERSAAFAADLERALASGQSGFDSDWTGTLQRLITLAKQANAEFEYDRAINYLENLQSIWDSKGLPEFSLDLRFELHREKGKAFASQGKLKLAIEEYQSILSFCRNTEQLVVKAETFSQIGQLLSKQGDYDRALGYLQRASGAYRRLNDQAGICRALRNIGVVYVELGEFDEAEINLDEAKNVAQEIGEELLYADLVNNLGAVSNMKGSWQQALEMYRKSLEIYEAYGEIRKGAYTQNNVAITLFEQGQNDEALKSFLQAYSIAERIHDASLALIVDSNLADLYLKKGMVEDATRHCRRAEKYFEERKLVTGTLVDTQKIAGKIALFHKKTDTALEYFNRALEMAKEIGAKYQEAEVLLERGILYRATDKHLDALTDLESSYRIYATIKAEGRREQTEQVIGSIETLYLEIFDSMARKVDQKDKYTKGHSDRVAAMSLLLARELGLRDGMLKTIVAAGLMHDIGKINIDDSVLKKAGRLTSEEYEHIKKHPQLGVELLRGKEFPWDIKPFILHHHEKIDGNGYPLGIKGEDIPLGARIICVADVFDALTSDRVYRKAFDTQKAIDIMEGESGTTFDPVLLGCFKRMINEGKADLVINSRTRDDEIYSIWSQCKLEEGGPTLGSAELPTT